MITILLTGCFSFDSQNKLIKEAKDPTATNKATLFLKEGGATVSDSYQVSILHKDHKLTNDEVGNTFTVDANHGATWLTDNSINLIWKKKDTLQNSL